MTAPRRQHRRQRRGPGVAEDLGDGYVVRDPARVSSNWRARRTWTTSCATRGVVGISGIDTQALTRHLRERGAMRRHLSVETDPQRC